MRRLSSSAIAICVSSSSRAGRASPSSTAAGGSGGGGGTPLRVPSPHRAGRAEAPPCAGGEWAKAQSTTAPTSAADGARSKAAAR
eukprot:CAMPEP_0119385040 /NCGR_PEP_ID=MMETSP1334-20130426/88972_1 /TAXON_ID=127549 /ORGANISM="Calcidiscus leptoporus, Strain RCC1130" /LENGTH=84 /DNA_ID=CAMNT_0007406229 /DNA_START=248 /DNA_END=499 /DNA_ORIENTATION=+